MMPPVTFRHVTILKAVPCSFLKLLFPPLPSLLMIPSMALMFAITLV